MFHVTFFECNEQQHSKEFEFATEAGLAVLRWVGDGYWALVKSVGEHSEEVHTATQAKLLFHLR